MHIVIDARIINSSTGTYVERLLYYLQQIDTTNRYTIIVPTKDKDFFIPQQKNFTVKPVDIPNYSLAEQVQLKSVLDNLQADLVHFCMPQQPIFYKGNHVTTFHDLTLLRIYNSDKNWLVFRAKQLVGRYVFKKVAASSRHIITPTHFVKNDLVTFAHISASKITVTYEAADIFKDKIKSYKHPFKKYLLYVGQQSDYKNIKRLGDAHQQLLATYPDLGLILVGKITKAHKINQAYFNSKGYRNILFTGFLPDAQRDWLFAHTSAYVFPSLMEGFGLPGLEAMGHGAPVVSSSATAMPEVYGDAAHYFDAASTDDMARAIKDVLGDTELRLRLVTKGYKQVKKYSWRRMAEQTYAVYMKSLKKA